MTTREKLKKISTKSLDSRVINIKYLIHLED